MLILAQSSNFWEAMTFLFPYLFVVALMSILAALGWDAGARTPAEPLLEDDSEAAMAHKLRSYSAPMLMLLNLITLGGFSFFWLNGLHGKLPKIRSDDPSSGKAIVMAMIPIYDFYWLPYSFSRLVLRINQQRKMREMEEALISGPLVGMVTCLLLTTVLALSALGMAFGWHKELPCRRDRFDRLLGAPLEVAVRARVETVTAHFQNSSSMASKRAVASSNSLNSSWLHEPANSPSPLS